MNQVPELVEEIHALPRSLILRAGDALHRLDAWNTARQATVTAKRNARDTARAQRKAQRANWWHEMSLPLRGVRDWSVFDWSYRRVTLEPKGRASVRYGFDIRVPWKAWQFIIVVVHTDWLHERGAVLALAHAHDTREALRGKPAEVAEAKPVETVAEVKADATPHTEA